MCGASTAPREIDVAGVEMGGALDKRPQFFPMFHHRGTEDAEGPSLRRSSDILGAAIEVHRRLGPGLLESAYEACLCRELLFRQIPFERQIPLSLDYRGIKVECGYRIDVIAYHSILVEVKKFFRSIGPRF